MMPRYKITEYFDYEYDVTTSHYCQNQPIAVKVEAGSEEEAAAKADLDLFKAFAEKYVDEHYDGELVWLARHADGARVIEEIPELSTEQLIAAAPELLALLDAARRQLDNVEEAELCAAIDEVIYRVTGREVE